MKGGWCLVYGPLFVIWDVWARVEGGGSRAEGRGSMVEGRGFRANVPPIGAGMHPRV